MSKEMLKTRIKSLDAEPLGDTESALRLQLAQMAKKQKAKNAKKAEKTKKSEKTENPKKTDKPVKSDKPKTEGESDGKKK